MASTYSTNLALELIGTGDQAGTWGNTTNTNLGTLIEQAISGYVTQAVSTGTDTTLTIPNGATGVARNMYIELTGTGGTNTNLIVPANKKLYFIFNNSTGAVTVKVSGQTGVSVPAGEKQILVSNGTDIVTATSYLTSVGTSLNLTTLTATSANITTLTSASATVTNLLGTTLTISGNSFLATSSGNVGIGTTSPASKLDIRNTGGTYDKGISLQTVSAGNIGTFWTSSTDLNIGIAGAHKFTNFDGSATRMTLDSSGNLGLGVTPSAWQTDVKAIQISDSGPQISGSNAAYSGANNLWIGNNSYQNSSVQNIYVRTAAAALYELNANSHKWYIAPSGTAGNTITFTQAMTLDASGNLLVGTTSATGKLTFPVNNVISWESGGTQNQAIYADGSSNLRLYTGNTERARITAGGNLLVGTTTDVSGLSGVISDVSGNVRNIPSAGAAKTSNYTLAITDIGEYVTIGTSGAITVPNDIFAAGNAVSLYNDTTGNATVSLTITTAYIAGTNTDKASVALATRGLATILFINPSLCVITGNVT